MQMHWSSSTTPLACSRRCTWDPFILDEHCIVLPYVLRGEGTEAQMSWNLCKYSSFLMNATGVGNDYNFILHTDMQKALKIVMKTQSKRQQHSLTDSLLRQTTQFSTTLLLMKPVWRCSVTRNNCFVYWVSVWKVSHKYTQITALQIEKQPAWKLPIKFCITWRQQKQ